MLDLSKFASVEDAIKEIDMGDRYTRVFTEIITDHMDMNLLTLFFASVISRSVGLHSAILREIRPSNPHGVIPLLRAFTEDAVLLMYVIDNPTYVKSLAVRAKDLLSKGPKRKSIQSPIGHSASVAPGFKLIYADLCEGSHFGSIEIWMSHSAPESEIPDVAANWRWSSAPHWKGESKTRSSAVRNCLSWLTAWRCISADSGESSLLRWLSEV